MNIYIAGPMRGKENGNASAFDAAAARLRALGHRVFNPADQGSADDPITLRFCLGVDTTWICAHAEAVALLPGWEDSKGATAEAALGFALGIRVAPIESFLVDLAPLN